MTVLARTGIVWVLDEGANDASDTTIHTHDADDHPRVLSTMTVAPHRGYKLYPRWFFVYEQMEDIWQITFLYQLLGRMQMVRST